MEVAAFYHVWADGAWGEPLAEYQDAVRNSGLDSEAESFHYGLVGSPANRNAVWRSTPDSDVAAKRYFIEADSGHEWVTLDTVWEYAHHHPHAAILYAHTKGSATVEPFRDRWRQSMTVRVVANWRENLAILEAGDVDAVGCHWLTEAQYPGMFGPMTIPAEGSGFFGGNFWMARCDYLRTLPPCEAEPRWKAESWIGINKPRVVDLLPGWPHDRRWPELCG